MTTCPSAVTLSQENKDLASLAIEIWRLEKKITKIGLSGDNVQSIDNSISKIKIYLTKNKIEVTDFTGSSYNDGLNVDVLSISDEKRDKPFISDTIEPMVKFNGNIVKRAKVIVTK